MKNFEKLWKSVKMAQFVTHIQPTLMETSQGHSPHHHGLHGPQQHHGHGIQSPPSNNHHHPPMKQHSKQQPQQQQQHGHHETHSHRHHHFSVSHFPDLSILPRYTKCPTHQYMPPIHLYIKPHTIPVTSDGFPVSSAVCFFTYPYAKISSLFLAKKIKFWVYSYADLRNI